MKSSEATTSDVPTGSSARGQRPARAAGFIPVLLNVDPRDVIRDRRTQAFRAAGYQVIEAASAADALAAIRQHTPSAALIDVNLPDSNSIDLCDTLKRLHPDLPVVLISRMGTSPEAREVPQPILADACVCEPIASDALAPIIEGLVARLVTPRESRVWVVSDDAGFILDVSEDAARLLNGTRRGLQQQSLLVFFEHDRDRWRRALVGACSGERVVQSGHLRPKERRPVAISVEIARATDWDRPAVRWAFDVRAVTALNRAVSAARPYVCRSRGPE